MSMHIVVCKAHTKSDGQNGHKSCLIESVGFWPSCRVPKNEPFIEKIEKNVHTHWHRKGAYHILSKSDKQNSNKLCLSETVVKKRYRLWAKFGNFQTVIKIELKWNSTSSERHSFCKDLSNKNIIKQPKPPGRLFLHGS